MKSNLVSLNFKLPVDYRYALELVANKRGVNLTKITGDAVIKMLHDEGLISEGDDGLCLLDKLWSEDENQRMDRLIKLAPQYLSREAKRALLMAKNGI